MRAAEQLVVETKSGKIEGLFEKGLYVFKSVPYAAPPIGDLRWLPPQPLQPWSGVRSAKAYAAIAPQIISAGPVPNLPEMKPEPQSEDCLYLNVWTPGLDDARRPVMVWIHGGAFVIGSGSDPMYRGYRLASRGNVVVVTINYRLGLLGFLNLNEITNGKIPATGNEGLLDQVAAVEWVRENIAAFGGNPRNITVFGESAGAMSLGCLMAMPGAQGLFQKVILESGVGSAARPLDISIKAAEDLFKVLDLKIQDSDKLRTMKVERLLEAQVEMTLKAPAGLTPVTPVIDGKVLPEEPLKAIQAGSAPNVSILAGTNRDEWNLFEAMNPNFGKMSEDALIDNLSKLMPDEKVRPLIEAYRDARLKRGEPANPYDIYSAIHTDIMFRIPMIRVLEARCNNRQPAYAYIFNWRSPAMGGKLGSCHILEIGFVFGKPEPSLCGSGPVVDRLTQHMQEAWLTFARIGNPSTANLGVWPQYCDNRQMMVLGQEVHVEQDPLSEERQIWNTLGDVAAG